MKKFLNRVWLNPLLRPVRALSIAYRYVFTGTKINQPYSWKDI